MAETSGEKLARVLASPTAIALQFAFGGALLIAAGLATKNVHSYLEKDQVLYEEGRGLVNEIDNLGSSPEISERIRACSDAKQACLAEARDKLAKSGDTEAIQVLLGEDSVILNCLKGGNECLGKVLFELKAAANAGARARVREFDGSR